MKKIVFAALLSLGLTPEIAAADPVGFQIGIECPSSNGTSGISNLSRFENYIGGYGVEHIQTQSNIIYFKSTMLLPHTAQNLSSYRNRNVSYNASTGIVDCNYISANPEEDAFTLSYQLTNGQGGIASSQSPNTILISLPVGVSIT